MTDVYQIEKIIGKRTKRGRKEYKVKWEGYPLSQCTWEPIENLLNVLYMVEDYDNSHSTANSDKATTVLGKKRKSDSAPSKPAKGPKQKEKKNHKDNSSDGKEGNGIICIENESSSDRNQKQYIRVITINKEFKALVEVKKDGLSMEETLSTRELRRFNPGILIDFYESKIKFTMKN